MEGSADPKRSSFFLSFGKNDVSSVSVGFPESIFTESTCTCSAGVSLYPTRSDRLIFSLNPFRN
jgi:hypothetical protein